MEKVGCIVLLSVPSELADKLAIDGYEKKEDLHITLVRVLYDDDSYVSEKQVKGNIVTSLFKLGLPPSVGQITGLKKFYNAQKTNQVAVVATVDIKDLRDWREQFLDLLTKEGVSVLNNMHFNPHKTLAYVDEDEHREEPLVISIDDDILDRDTEFGGVEVKINNEVFALTNG